MKKIILFSMLLLSTKLLATDSANMNINATVMETLTVRKDEDVEFGKLAKGTSNNKAYGLYSVKGQGGEIVDINIGGIVNNTIPMTHISGATIYATIDRVNDKITCIQDSYVQADKLNFTLDVPDSAVTGEYTGEIIIKARYM